MSNSFKVDFVICSVPKYTLGAPLQGPAVLKSALRQAGFTCRLLDLNLAFAKRISDLFPGKSWAELEPVFAFERCFDSKKNIFIPLMDEWARQILAYSPRNIGISVFTQRSFFIARGLSRSLRERDFSGPILWGGGYVAHCGEDMKMRGTIDHYVIGEGERAIVEFAKGNPHAPGLDSAPNAEVTLGPYPGPDYSDFDLSEYSGLYITGSRSCPYHCSFCENPGTWGKFRIREPREVALEIKDLCRSTGISKFYFTDNLINGSLPLYRDLMKAMGELGVAIRWDAFFVIRSRREMPPADFDLAAKAGARTIRIGVESGSERVRAHMGKKFQEKDLEYFLDQFRRTGIKTDLMLIVGYPTEEQVDFELTLELLRRYKEYSDAGVIGHVRIVPLAILPRSALWNLRRELGIVYDGEDLGSWRRGSLNRALRLQRYQEARSWALSLGYKVRSQQDEERNALFSRADCISFPGALSGNPNV